MISFILTGILGGVLGMCSFLPPDSLFENQQIQPLDDLKWEKRIVLVFMPEANHPAGTRQIQLFKQEQEELEERDLLLIPVIGYKIIYQPAKPGEGQKLRKTFTIAEKGFTLILIGKDGGEKYRAMSVVEPTAIFRIIDSMPMRQSEINRHKNKK